MQNGTVTTTTGAQSQNCSVSYEESKAFLIVVYSTVCALGFPANCLTLFLTWKQVKQNNVLAVYLFFLSVCELLYISTLPFWIRYITQNHMWDLGEFSCQMIAFLFFCNIYISILLLCCISIDRFRAVVFALESRGLRQQWTAVLLSVLVFVSVGLVHAPVFQIASQNHTCFEALPVDSQTAKYYYTRFVVGFVVPFAIIVYTNYRIFRSIKKSVSLKPRQKTKVKYLAIAIIVIFLICFAPYHVVILVRALHFSRFSGDMCDFEKRVYTSSVVFLCLSTVNSVADPIIYVFVSENCRNDLSRIFRGWNTSSAIQANRESTGILSKELQEFQESPRSEIATCLPPQS
ncbi:probable G-protein coupled receptor 132 [Tachyglossus aculeatus]|uniref:probable G-protein coupled receptor 132 n=1 Tax=Tachyglossus aculeatus TaxID=9261 RepID=UPI0018F3A25E|nr:probable G-protein coupled receptor 132 [Tachyglossus aculeatus]